MHCHIHQLDHFFQLDHLHQFDHLQHIDHLQYLDHLQHLGHLRHFDQIQHLGHLQHFSHLQHKPWSKVESSAQEEGRVMVACREYETFSEAKGGAANQDEIALTEIY